jgi:hypothetical protein
MTTLAANVLRIAATAVDLTDVSVVQAVDVAMTYAGTGDVDVFCGALEAINACDETDREHRGDRLRHAARIAAADLD